MSKVLVKGHEIEVKITKSAYDRKALIFANNIKSELKKLGVLKDDVKIPTNIIGNKNIPATVEFWLDGHYMRFSYSITKRYIDNLYVIMKLIEKEVDEVLTGKKEIQEFYFTFSVDFDRKDINKEVAKAKVTLGLNEDETDVKIIDDAYRKLAKIHHPDLGGSLEEFQKINKANKLIKKEMGL